MCHGYEFSSDRLKEEIARELLEEVDDESVPAEDASDPSFLNEERETEVDILTDGGPEA